MKRIGFFLFTAISTVFLAATCSVFGQPAQYPVRPGIDPVAQTPHVQSADIPSAQIPQVQHLQPSSESKGDVIRWAPVPTEQIVRDLPDPALPRAFSLVQPRRTSENASPLPAPRIIGNSGLLLASAPASEIDSPNKGNVTFAGPIVSGDRSNVSFDTAGAPPAVEHPAAAPTFPQPIPVANELPVYQPQTDVPVNTLPVFQQPTVAANGTPSPAPAVTARQVAQNAITQSHRLRLQPQVFESNLVEKLGSRFVPVRNVAESSGIAQYRLPAKDGTDIELVVNRPQGTVTVTGAPGMVEASLRIVRLLDVEEVAGGPVARFVPVQQSSVNAARQVANIVNQETMRVAQIDRPPIDRPAIDRPAVAGTLPPGLSEDDLSAAGVVGPVQIEIIDAFGTVIIQGTPEDVRIIQGMLQQMETLSLENEPIIELLPMRHTDSLRVATWAAQLYQQVYLVRRGVVIMMPLVKPNTILIIGRQESVDAAKELIAKLDTPAIPNASFRVFPLRYAAALDLQTSINNALANRPGTGQYMSLQVTVIGDLRTNALMVHASPRDMLEIEAMIREFDIPGGQPTVEVKRFPLKNSMATEMVTVLNTAITSSVTGRASMISLNRIDEQGNLVRSSAAYNVSVVADTRGNSLIVTAPSDTMALIEALIEELDSLPTAESRIRVFTLANGDAFTLTTLLTNLFGTTTAAGAGQVTAARPGFEEGESTLIGVRFQAEIRTNSIVAIGSEADLAIAEALLLRLDAENLNNRTVFTMKLINTPADEIAPILNSYFTTERQFNIQNAATLLPNSPLEQYRMETNVIAEPASNSLIISTTPRYYEEVRRIVLAIDERPMMVAIDVLIAEVSLRRNRDRGVEFGLRDSILFNTASGTPANPLGILPGTVPFVQNNAGSIGTQGITSLGMPNPAGTGGFSFAASSESVSIFIRALETNERTQVLARPRLVTIHNRNASIQVGDRVPYASNSTINNYGNPTISTGFVEVGTILDITPRIMPDGMVALALYVERSSHTLISLSSDVMAPQIKTTNAQTTINAMDGQTVIFAGLISEVKETVNNSIPGLNKIPVIKHLFEYDSKKYDRSELLIVMTPRIIRTPEDMMLLNQQERERMSWCVSDVVRLTGDSGMRLRSDEWFPSEVRYINGAPVILQESQLPPDNKIPTPMFPVLETK